MEELVKIVIAVLVVILLGFGVQRFFDAITNNIKLQPQPPENVDQKYWKEVLIHPSAGVWLGFLERLISLIAFWMNAHVIIAAWLAFKVATKWEVWKNIIQVPASLENTPELSYLKARNAWGTWLFNRFLIGTLINLLIGFVAYCLGKNLFLIIDVLT